MTGRPAGDLIPWTVSNLFQDENFPQLSGVRIVRIATHPDAQGVSTKYLAMLDIFFVLLSYYLFLLNKILLIITWIFLKLLYIYISHEHE